MHCRADRCNGPQRDADHRRSRRRMQRTCRAHLPRRKQMRAANRATRSGGQASAQCQRRTLCLPPGGGPMPIYRLVERETFDPEVVTLLCEVFEDVLNTLGLVDRLDPLTELVAEKIIELAHSGQRDRKRLKQLTLEAFQGRKA